MINYRLYFLLLISLVYFGWTPTNKAEALMSVENWRNTGEIGKIAQQKTPNSDESSSSTSEKGNYDRYMQAGYQATKDKDYSTALKQFQQALEERPQDIYAQQAIHNIEAYLTNKDNLLSNLDSKELGLLLGAIAILAGIGIGLWIMIKRVSEDAPEDFKKESESPNISHKLLEKDPDQYSTIKPKKSSNNSIVTPEIETEQGAVPTSNLEEKSPFPIQATTRLPNLDIIEELLKDLQEIDPKKRRKAIWELAQKADSRAMKPLVDLMIDTDSQERTLILEALSQISSRTLKPMNQALAISLQDKNPQVRKNAIRDLTRIYDIMSQISQLLCHAIDDSDHEVQETAQWALNQLNLQMPPRWELVKSQDSDSLEIGQSTLDP